MNYNNIAMVDAYLCRNSKKWQKNHISRQANNKQGSADVFRSSSDYGKMTIAFLNSVKKQARYSVCVLILKTSK